MSMMQKFLLRLSITFIILLTIMVIFMVGLVAYIQQNVYYPITATTLVLGNSHPECAIDDSHLQQLKNLSRSAEPLYYTKQKLLWLLKWNPGIRKVFVELSENQLESRMSEWIWSEQSLQRQTLSLFPFLTLEHHMKALQKSPFSYLQSLILGAKRSLEGVLLTEGQDDFFKLLEWGGYRGQKGSHLSQAIENQQRANPEMLIPDPDNLTSLFDIIKICKTCNVELMFIRCPYHPENNDNFEESFHGFLLNHPEITFLDFKRTTLKDDYFFDLQHLNENGAKFFTKEFLRKVDQVND